MNKPISAEISKKAFERLNELLTQKLTLLLGGGGAMILAHGFPLATTDIDAVPLGPAFDGLDDLVKKIAKELKLSGDWLNPYFSTFLHTLPTDYTDRLIKVFSGKMLTVQALGATDMLILKCFAGRQKDVTHTKALIKKGADVQFVESHIEKLAKNNIPGVASAFEFLDDILEQT